MQHFTDDLLQCRSLSALQQEEALVVHGADLKIGMLEHRGGLIWVGSKRCAVLKRSLFHQAALDLGALRGSGCHAL